MAKKVETFHSEEYGCSFSLPKPFCLRHMEQFDAGRDAAKAAGATYAPTIRWLGALEVMEDWKCEDLPDPRELGALGDVHGKQLKIFLWVAAKVFNHILNEVFIPKN